MLEQLRQRLQALQKTAGTADGARTLPLGIAAIDAALGGGLARGALHEIAAPSEAHLAAATGFALGLSSSRSRDKPGPDGRGNRIVWIAEDMALAESGAPYGPGLDGFGLAPERLLTVAVARVHDLLWAMEEALRCRAVHAVIGELRRGVIDSVTLRRLSLAAAENGALALLLRGAPSSDASTAATRWIVGASPSVIPGRREAANPESITPAAEYGFQARGLMPASRHDEEIRPRFAVALLRNRRGPTGSWILEWSDNDERFILATHAQPVAAPVLDRPHRNVA
jgi:protein ImuA